MLLPLPRFVDKVNESPGAPIVDLVNELAGWLRLWLGQPPGFSAGYSGIYALQTAGKPAGVDLSNAESLQWALSQARSLLT